MKGTDPSGAQGNFFVLVSYLAWTVPRMEIRRQGQGFDGRRALSSSYGHNCSNKGHKKSPNLGGKSSSKSSNEDLGGTRFLRIQGHMSSK